MDTQRKHQLEAEIKECNEQCQSCMDSFLKEDLTFSPSYCRYCSIGSKLHRLLTQISEAEACWGNLDWNSCKYERFYNG